MTFAEAVDTIGRAVEAAGVGINVLGALYATLVFPLHLRRVSGTEAYRRYREGLGRAILLGLEFLVAADIIRTVTTTPTFRRVGVLAVVVLIRTFLSASLQLEIEGRWPWQRREAPGDGVMRGGPE